MERKIVFRELVTRPYPQPPHRLTPSYDHSALAKSDLQKILLIFIVFCSETAGMWDQNFIMPLIYKLLIGFKWVEKLKVNPIM